MSLLSFIKMYNLQCLWNDFSFWLTVQSCSWRVIVLQSLASTPHTTPRHNTTHTNYLIKVFRIARIFQAGMVWDKLGLISGGWWLSRTTIGYPWTKQAKLLPKNCCQCFMRGVAHDTRIQVRFQVRFFFFLIICHISEVKWGTGTILIKMLFQKDKQQKYAS